MQNSPVCVCMCVCPFSLVAACCESWGVSFTAETIRSSPLSLSLTVAEAWAPFHPLRTYPSVPQVPRPWGPLPTVAGGPAGCAPRLTPNGAHSVLRLLKDNANSTWHSARLDALLCIGQPGPSVFTFEVLLATTERENATEGRRGGSVRARKERAHERGEE